MDIYGPPTGRGILRVPRQTRFIFGNNELRAPSFPPAANAAARKRSPMISSRAARLRVIFPPAGKSIYREKYRLRSFDHAPLRDGSGPKIFFDNRRIRGHRGKPQERDKPTPIETVRNRRIFPLRGIDTRRARPRSLPLHFYADSNLYCLPSSL